jgi:hypothetical protein
VTAKRYKYDFKRVLRQTTKLSPSRKANLTPNDLQDSLRIAWEIVAGNNK